MRRLDPVDTRPVFRAFNVLVFVTGIAIMAYPFPEPARFAAATVDRHTAWVTIKIVAGNAIWCFGMLTANFARIEEAASRRVALRNAAGILVYIGVLYFSPAWPQFRTILPPWVAAPPFAVGLLLFYFSLAPRRRRIASASGAAVFYDRPSPRGRFEASIRQAARQEERARLARDLHDAVKQQLFVIQTAAATVEQRLDGDHPGAQAALSQVRASARDALTEMEVMLDQLQAVPIGNAGLIESLKRQCEVVTFRTGADVRFTPGPLPPDIAFPPGVHQAMLRFAQEALANVARHARATEVTVTLHRQDRLVVLSVADNGQGFDMNQPPVGMGLSNMDARAADAEGTYTVKSAPGEGTTVSLLLEPDGPDRSTFLAWTLGAAVLMIASLALLRAGIGSVPYVVVVEVVGATVLVDNLRAWWRARQWP